MGTTVYNVTNYAPDVTPIAPLYPQAVVLPVLAFPSWIICLSPMIWHFRQGNIAAGSLMTWIVLNNFFNSINPLIWPRDNLLDWWDGHVWCDIHIRIQVGSIVGLAASTVLVTRKLARVMDTRNITMSSSRSSQTKEKIWEVVLCWGYPLLMIIVYYVVQPVRYMLYGIVGCMSATDTSWPSVVLSFMWGPITMMVAAYYASLLNWRLYRYRREFHRLVAARNTTSSRFVRLFIMSMVIICFYLPYSIYLLVELSLVATDPYSWSVVHNPSRLNTIMRIPVYGQVSYEKWIQVGTGYILFLIFGTGVDAHILYKRILTSIGLGKIWPSLYVEHDTSSRPPSSFIVAKRWTSNISSKARSMFSSKTESTIDTLDETIRNNSVVLQTMPRLHTASTGNMLLRQEPQDTRAGPSSTKPSLLRRMFARSTPRGSILPLSSYRNITEITETDKSYTSTSTAGAHAHAWASDSPAASQISEIGGVYVVREVRQDRHEKGEHEKEMDEVDAWA